jgi:hypothetical protein
MIFRGEPKSVLRNDTLLLPTAHKTAGWELRVASKPK